MAGGLRRSALGLFVAVAFAFSLGFAFAQTPKDADPAREQSIYIPYKNLRTIFEKEGRGVFIPYEKFMELWKDRLERNPGPETARLPVDSLIGEIANTATVSKDVVSVSSVLKIEVLKEGWNEVSLRLGDAAITKALLDGAPARIVFDKDSGYKLLIEKKGPQPQTYTLVLDFAKAYVKAPGQNSVSFQTPQAPVSRWELHVPESGVKVNIQPLLAATEAPAAPKAEETVVLAFVGATSEVRIDWTPKAEGAKGLTALASVIAETQMDIEEGVTRTHVKLAYSISRAELTGLVIEVPADQKVVNVFDPNVREWTVEPGAAGAPQKISVQLFEPAKDSQLLTVELQKFLADATQEITAPVVKAVGVGRQQGVVVVRVADALRSEAVKRTGLLQVDAAELPASLANIKWHYSYRYAALPFELALSIEKIKPRIEVDSLLLAHLKPEELTLDLVATYTIERAGVFRLDLTIPKGYDVRTVTGAAVANGVPAQVDTHHLEGADNTLLVVNLSRKAMGVVCLQVQLFKKLTEPDLLSPTGKSVTIPLAVPGIPVGSVARQTGRIIVFAPESLRVNPGETKGLRPISFEEAKAGALAANPSDRAILTFASTDEPVTVSLTAERRKPYVTARQLLAVRVEPGVVTYDVTLNYEVLYSGVKSLRLDVPAEIAADLRITSPNIRYQVMDDTDKPADLAAGYVAWKLTGQAEFLGDSSIALKWEKKLEKLDVGKSVDIVIPRLKPVGADRAWGQIVLTKGETIDVRPAKLSDTLRPIDPQHDLMPGASVPGAARAFEFHEDWDLTVAATQYKLQEIVRTSIDRALVRMVVTRADVTSVQALYRMRSQQQRLHIKLPANTSFDTEPLRIDGRPVTLEQGDLQNNIFSVPLVGTSQDRPFLLELRYTVRGAGLSLECPVFPDDPADIDAKGQPAVQKAYLSVYIPQELAYLGSRGPWTDEMVWRRLSGFTPEPLAMQPDQSLLAWVSAELPLAPSALRAFETDGAHYLYSTLRPVAPPKGALRIVAVRDGYLSIFVLVVVIGGGLLLLRARLTSKAFAAGVSIIVLVLLAVFFPSFARRIVDGTLVGSVVIVLVLWAFWWLLTRYSARRLQPIAPLASGVSQAPPPSSDKPASGPSEGGSANA